MQESSATAHAGELSHSSCRRAQLCQLMQKSSALLKEVSSCRCSALPAHAKDLSTAYAKEFSTTHVEEFNTAHAEEPSTVHAEELSTAHAEELSTAHAEELSSDQRGQLSSTQEVRSFKRAQL